jgi:hypothetical protein
MCAPPERSEDLQVSCRILFSNGTACPANAPTAGLTESPLPERTPLLKPMARPQRRRSLRRTAGPSDRGPAGEVSWGEACSRPRRGCEALVPGLDAPVENLTLLVPQSTAADTRSCRWSTCPDKAIGSYRCEFFAGKRRGRDRRLEQRDLYSVRPLNQPHSPARHIGNIGASAERKHHLPSRGAAVPVTSTEGYASSIRSNCLSLTVLCASSLHCLRATVSSSFASARSSSTFSSLERISILDAESPRDIKSAITWKARTSTL